MASAGGSVDALAELPARLERWPAIANVVAALARGDSGTIDGAWGSSCALLCGTIARAAPSAVLIVLPRIHDVDDFAADLSWYSASPPTVLSAWDGRLGERSIADPVFSARLHVLRALESTANWQRSAPHPGPLPAKARGEGDKGDKVPPCVIVASLVALMQPVPARAERSQATRRIARGDTLDVDNLLQWLVERGFERSSAIERPGEFSVHGGIVDVFAPGSDDPVRIELFGDEVESLRSFDVETQRKVAELDATELIALAPRGADGRGQEECFVDVLPEGTWVAIVEPDELAAEGEHYVQRLGSSAGLYSVPEVLAKCTERPSVTIAAVSGASFDASAHLQIESVERFSGRKSEAFSELESVLSPGESVLIACHNEAERERLHELIGQSAPGLLERARLSVGTVTHGFRLVPERLVVLSDHELFGRVDIRRAARRRRPEGRAIDSFLDLSPGDLVVHLAHGIGRFRGLELVKRGTGAGGMNAPEAFRRGEDDTPALEEHLVLEFRDGVRMFVPVSLIHLVQKYVGPAKGTPDLSRIGGTLWSKQKKRVTEAVTDMAADMLRLQAVRHARPGIPCEPDSHLQQEFESSFPYVETVDQLRAIEESKADLERSEPMDRLICGDVGFGKTEVALRAAFKVVDSGRQVAVLVPTTVLADQHYRTFCDRMAEYPINIDVVSRFRTKGEQREILTRLENGGIDILIGTHRLVSPDVKFQDLGLLIIDEEQRFGVAAKEQLKQLRLSVDVLTLSATPIPRTLHMSLLGIRDISNLTTPPPDRQPIETRIGRWDAELIRHAVVRELNRGGQVYFVHNKVYNIRTIADRLQSIVPEAKLGIVHGQMHEHELEENMLAFVAGRVDILVATTIIESGLDIPNANTIFIHEADRYGLADLHQLRGRVGRYKHRAYCYLIVEEGRILTRPAAKRLKAIQEFSELGAGFKIAMRDLEIRGAGNILGTEQSGHIAAVGYELYCQLLENAVRHLKGEAPRVAPHVHIDLPIEAYLPSDYVPPGRQKLDVYRGLSAVTTVAELAAFHDELRDRFGPLPEVAENHVALRELELLAFAWKITTVRLEEGYAVFEYADAVRIRELVALRQKQLRVVDARSAFLVLPNPPMTGRSLVEHLKSVLR